MRICIPVNDDAGVQSTVCQHFGSSPMFMVVDTESGDCRALKNRNEHHAHGMCQPLQALQGEQLDGLVVAGIGTGALMKLMGAGMRVFLTEHATVEQTLAALKKGALRPATPERACAGHGQGHGHG
jgi:predicted Fe-Mo cluster-binding NifX family protein